MLIPCTIILMAINLAISKSNDQAIEIEVILDDYNQRHCVTQCTENLLENDILYISAFVKRNSNTEILQGSFTLYKKGTKDFVFNDYKVVFVKKCNEPDSEFTCIYDEIKDRYKIILNETADESLSEAQLKLVVTFDDTTNTSSEISLPIIYDPRKIVIELNDIIVGDETRSLTLANKTVKLCCKNAPSPCHVYLVHDGVETNDRSNCITHDIHKSDMYSIGYNVCNDKKFSRRYDINITLENSAASRSSEDSEFFDTWIVGSIGVVSVACALIFIIVASCCNRNKYTAVRTQDSGQSGSSNSTEATYESNNIKFTAVNLQDSEQSDSSNNTDVTLDSGSPEVSNENSVNKSSSFTSTQKTKTIRGIHFESERLHGMKTRSADKEDQSVTSTQTTKTISRISLESESSSGLKTRSADQDNLRQRQRSAHKKNRNK